LPWRLDFESLYLQFPTQNLHGNLLLPHLPTTPWDLPWRLTARPAMWTDLPSRPFGEIKCSAKIRPQAQAQACGGEALGLPSAINLGVPPGSEAPKPHLRLFCRPGGSISQPEGVHPCLAPRFDRESFGMHAPRQGPFPESFDSAACSLFRGGWAKGLGKHLPLKGVTLGRRAIYIYIGP
jgi:hypothetical protein